MKTSILEKLKERLYDLYTLGAMGICLGYWFLTLLFLEGMVHLSAFGAPKGEMLYIAGFSLVFACVLTLLTSFMPEKLHFPVMAVITVVLIVLYGSQMVYEFVFGTLYSVSQMGMGGAAVTNFLGETLSTMRANVLWLLPLFVPLIALILLRGTLPGVFVPGNWVFRLGLVALAAVLQLGIVQGMRIEGTGYFSNYYYYTSEDVVTNTTGQRFGVLTTMRLELFGAEVDAEDSGTAGSGYELATTPTVPASTTGQEDDVTVPGETTETVPAVTEPEYNVLNIDFDALNGLTEDETIRAINNYCAGLTGTAKNEYTGMLSDYNLIVLCGEAFSTAAIHPELTPTLYRLANEGIIFNNYYNSYPNTTTDGEYALCLGLHPDITRGNHHSSFYATRNSYLPFTLGNVFKEQAGIDSYGYHNHIGNYYGRDETHPNMGYSMKFNEAGLTLTQGRPTSDLEMMQQSVDDYISADKQFHAYYMTFSGHYQYDKSINAMARKNWELVENTSYTYETKAYLACNIELDRALEYLMQRLEEEGIADKTAIVLAGDHFPYGLTDRQYSELIDYELDDFSRYKSTLIFWVGGLEENIVVDEYCCNVDILPTILNLWGFSYDSRLLGGTDVFSDAEHMAIFRNKSVLTDQVWINAETGEIRFLVDESQIPAGYVDYLMSLVTARFTLCTDILNTAYYNFLFEKGEVEVDKASWWIAPEAETPEVPEGGGDVGGEEPGGGDVGGEEPGGGDVGGEEPGGGDVGGEEPGGGDVGGEEPGGGDVGGGDVGGGDVGGGDVAGGDVAGGDVGGGDVGGGDTGGGEQTPAE